eukprot:g2372.t1
MNGRKYDECVGDTDKKSAFNMWYRECKAELKSKMSHLPLVDILSPVLKKKRLSRRISVIPESDTDQHENYSIHILIMWIMQATSRSRSGNLAYRAVQETLGVEDGNTKTMIFDTMNHSLTTIDISTKALMVKITSVLTVQRCEDEIDFEFDVCCSTTQTLDLESFIFDRSIEFDYLKCAAAGEDKAKFAKLRKKQPLNTIVRMDSINFKENHSELEVLAKVYHPDDFEDCKKNVAAATKSGVDLASFIPLLSVAHKGSRALVLLDMNSNSARDSLREDGEVKMYYIGSDVDTCHTRNGTYYIYVRMSDHFAVSTRISLYVEAIDVGLYCWSQSTNAFLWFWMAIFLPFFMLIVYQRGRQWYRNRQVRINASQRYIPDAIISSNANEDDVDERVVVAEPVGRPKPPVMARIVSEDDGDDDVDTGDAGGDTEDVFTPSSSNKATI